MKGHYIRYSREELEFIEWRQAMSRRALHEAFVVRFGRTDVTLSNLNSLCKRKGWSSGRTGRFEKGQPPANKGRLMPAETKAKLARTWFRKGSLNGKAAKKYKPIGTERLCKNGYRERKVSDDGLPQRRWRAVHLIEWEALNGPVPEGHCLKCLDGDRLNTDPANWEAIPRALLPRLSGGRWWQPYQDYEPEVRPSVLAVARLEHAAREKSR